MEKQFWAAVAGGVALLSSGGPQAAVVEGTFTADDGAAADLQQEYGGATAAGRFAWRRSVEWLGFKNVRLVHIDVHRADDDRTLATMEFLVRRPATSQGKGS